MLGMRASLRTGRQKAGRRIARNQAVAIQEEHEAVYEYATAIEHTLVRDVRKESVPSMEEGTVFQSRIFRCLWNECGCYS